MNVGDKVIYCSTWKYLPTGARGKIIALAEDMPVAKVHFKGFGVKHVKLVSIRLVSALELLAEVAE